MSHNLPWKAWEHRSENKKDGYIITDKDDNQQAQTLRICNFEI